MLDGDKYGGQVGQEVALHFPLILDIDEAEQLAYLVLKRLRRQGQAHLDPEEKFIRSFVVSFLVGQSLHYPSMEVAS